ncbi:hypothetical protein LCGC14_3142780, partial [marine sediment metagenome]
MREMRLGLGSLQGYQGNKVTLQMKVGMDLVVIRDTELIFSLALIEHPFSYVLYHRPREALSVWLNSSNALMVVVGKLPRVSYPSLTKRILGSARRTLRSLWDIIVETRGSMFMLILQRLIVAVFLSGALYWYLQLEPAYRTYRTGSIQVLIMALAIMCLVIGVSGVHRLHAYRRRKRV